MGKRELMNMLIVLKGNGPFTDPEFGEKALLLDSLKL